MTLENVELAEYFPLEAERFDASGLWLHCIAGGMDEGMASDTVHIVRAMIAFGYERPMQLCWTPEKQWVDSEGQFRGYECSGCLSHVWYDRSNLVKEVPVAVVIAEADFDANDRLIGFELVPFHLPEGVS